MYRSEWQWARRGYRLKRNQSRWPSGYGRVGQPLYSSYQVYFVGAPRAVSLYRPLSLRGAF
jgi:hypothetical protein